MTASDGNTANTSGNTQGNTSETLSLRAAAELAGVSPSTLSKKRNRLLNAGARMAGTPPRWSITVDQLERAGWPVRVSSERVETPPETPLNGLAEMMADRDAQIAALTAKVGDLNGRLEETTTKLVELHETRAAELNELHTEIRRLHDQVERGLAEIIRRELPSPSDPVRVETEPEPTRYTTPEEPKRGWRKFFSRR